MDDTAKLLEQIAKTGTSALGDIKKVDKNKVDHSKRIYSAEMKKEFVRLLREKGTQEEEIVDTLLDLDDADESGDLKLYLMSKQ